MVHLRGLSSPAIPHREHLEGLNSVYALISITSSSLRPLKAPIKEVQEDTCVFCFYPSASAQVDQVSLKGWSPKDASKLNLIVGSGGETSQDREDREDREPSWLSLRWSLRRARSSAKKLESSAAHSSRKTPGVTSISWLRRGSWLTS